uniref:Ionotropic glutamate receptor C-terminal domain-containing protein n=1 Tax=Anopheles culicifacies TaxID=139723 RepID=A0A182LUZ0_9DIPT
MQRKHLYVWFMLCCLIHPRAGESQQQLVDFVAHLKATHLSQCREIALVFVESLPVASEMIQLHSNVVPIYTCQKPLNAAVQGVDCGIIFTTLYSHSLNLTRNFFSNKAKLLFIVDVQQRTTFSTSTVENFMATQMNTWLYNTVVIMFNAFFSKGYYFDPFHAKFKELAKSSRSIYPSLRDLYDLQNYRLHFAYIPRESDSTIIDTIVNSLSNRRNGSLEEAIGLDPIALLNLSSTLQWRFTLLTLGPLEYGTCFFVPRAGLQAIGYMLVAPFDAATWTGILLTGVVIVILLKLFGKASLFGSVIMLLQSVFTSPNRIARSYFERRILTACMLGCLVLISSYQSIIYSLISNPIYHPELDTEQLINSSCSIFMLTSFEGIDTFRNTFTEKVHFQNGKSCVCSTCQLKNLTQAHPQQFKQYRLSRHRTHPFPMLISLIDREYPPLHELVQLYVSGYFESGLTVKMLRDGQQMESSVEHFRESKQSAQFPGHQLAMSDLQIVWIVLEIGLMCASISFLGELAWKYAKNRITGCKVLFVR